MKFNNLILMHTVTSAAQVASEKWESKKKLGKMDDIISHTLSHMRTVLSYNDERFENIVELEHTTNLYFCIFGELCAFKQYRSLPEDKWSTVVDETYEMLHNELTECIIFRPFKHPEEISKRLKKVFIKHKVKYLDAQLISDVTLMIENLRVNTSKSEHTDMSLDNTLEKFLLTYDPNNAEYTWEEAFNKIKQSEENNLYKKESKYTPLSIDDANNNGLLNEPAQDIIEDDYTLLLLRKCDMLRDLLITPKKCGITGIQYGYYKCFFTDNLSYMQDESVALYRHLIRNLKKYSNHDAIDIDFLNYFVDAHCNIITDAYHQPRKLLRNFKPEKKTNERCKQPLELTVIGKYLGKSDSSVSTFRTDYNELLKTKLREDTFDSERRT